MKTQSTPVSLHQALLNGQRVKAWEYAFWALALASPWLLKSQALLVNEIAIAALFALSLDLILGYGGIVSLGHAAFLGFGAYSAALLAKHGVNEPVTGLLLGTLSATLLGAFASFTVLRGTDLTRLMVTLGLSLILLELANKLDHITGGADGLQGVVMGAIAGRFEFDLSGQTAATYSLLVLLGFFVLMRQLVQSPWGNRLQAVRDNPLRATAMGVNGAREIAVAYTLAAGMAGAAGALLAQTTGFASLDVFAVERSADVMLMLIIGGAGWLYGGVLGAVAFKLLHHWVAAITPQYWTFWMGLFLVLLMLLGRERLLKPWHWPLLQSLGARWQLAMDKKKNAGGAV